MKRLLLPILISALLAACGQQPGAGEAQHSPATASKPENVDEPGDVIARVAGQAITFSEINTMINSSAIVGLSMPELGSPERDTVRITLLDKLISANLLYLDAIDSKADQDPGYQNDVRQFADALLATLYRSKRLVGEIEVKPEEVETFYRDNIVENTEFTDELRLGIEATIRKQRLKQRTAGIRERLREGHKVSIIVTELDPEEDQVRDADDVVASLDGAPITWGEVRMSMRRAHTLQSIHKRVEALENIVDTRIMVQLARAAGLERDPVFLARYGEYKKTRLINLHRNSLMEQWEPNEQEISEFYDANRGSIVSREMRKVQMLVVETAREAEDIKHRIESHEITFHKAVADHSILPDAGKTLGQIGWVSQGSGFPELDEETFMLEAGDIGGPVQSPAGWHLVRVLDQRDAMHEDLGNEQTRKKARKMLLDDRLDQYVINLRKEKYPVDIDGKLIGQLAQQEIDWYQEMLQKSQKSPEEVIEEIQRLRKM